MSIIIKPIITGLLEVNSLLIIDELAKQAVCVDPSNDPHEILDFLSNHNLDLTHIVLTHSHFDHIFGIPNLREKYEKCKILVSEEDRQLYGMFEVQLGWFNMKHYPHKVMPAPDTFKAGEALKITDKLTIDTIFTPGHTPGGVLLLVKDEDKPIGLITGDTIFSGGGIGRYDVPLANGDDLAKSIETFNNLKLPSDLPLYCGHGFSSTVGKEQKYARKLY